MKQQPTATQRELEARAFELINDTIVDLLYRRTHDALARLSLLKATLQETWQIDPDA